MSGAHGLVRYRDDFGTELPDEAAVIKDHHRHDAAHMRKAFEATLSVVARPSRNGD